VGDEVVGAISAGRAAGGDLDNACARAGLDKIKESAVTPWRARLHRVHAIGAKLMHLSSVATVIDDADQQFDAVTLHGLQLFRPAPCDRWRDGICACSM
jgi:hypothetical protein